MQTPDNEGGGQRTALDTIIGNDKTLTADLKDGGGGVVSEGSALDLKTSTQKAAEEIDGEGEAGKDAETTDTSGKGGEEGPEQDTGSGDPLPDFKADDPEVVQKYDARFFADGKRNDEAFAAEIMANVEANKEPRLNEGTYAYLEGKLPGVSRDDINTYIDGVIAKQGANETAFYTKVGGKETWDAQVEWGKANYSDAQKAAFRKAMKAGGEEALEAAELLASRFEKAGQKVPTPPAPKAERGVSPKKTSSEAGAGEGGGGKATPFADQAEYRKALKEAGRNPAAQALVRKRLVASKFWQ